MEVEDGIFSTMKIPLALIGFVFRMRAYTGKTSKKQQQNNSRFSGVRLALS